MVRPLPIVAGLMLATALVGCSQPPPSDQAPLIQQAFEGFKDQIALAHSAQALAYLDHPTLDYLQQAATRPPSLNDTAVDALIRRASQKLAPQTPTPDLKVEVPLQNLLDKVAIPPADLGALTLGPVAVDATGKGAHAEALWAGKPTTLQIMFVQEQPGSWKINLLNLLGYASTAMTMDRTLKGETEDQQIERLLRSVPSP